MSSAPSVPTILRVYTLPALWLFALPLFGMWFAGHATGRFDREVLSSIETQLTRDTELTGERREDLLEFYRAFPASVACASSDEELAGYRESLGETCSSLAHFEGMRVVALGSLLLGLVTGLIALLCAGAAFVSRPLQYSSFVVGWNVLRITGALQVLAQGGLLVWLSYWMTAVWFESYYPKLILIVGGLVAVALFQVVAAIFRQPTLGFAVEAEALEETQAPEFWAHVRTLCERLGTLPPDHILAGIDTNFFVTEHPVHLGERTLEGRTLFVSLSLLRLLERSEADAVLAHEVGHLLGGDTGHSKRLAPMLTRFGDYLQALREGGLTLPLFHFMAAYRSLFELSLGRSRRASELAADRLAASITSGRDIAYSLVKTGAYANFRARVEDKLFAEAEQQQSLAIAQRVALGFTDYASSETVQVDIHGTTTPHPFDTHPSLAARLENVGERLAPEDVMRVLLEPTRSSWVNAIPEADLIETRMWGVYEARFAEQHDLALAYRYEPTTDAERAHVEKHFPPLVFAGKEEGVEVRLDYAQVTSSGWEAPLRLADVGTLSTDERLFKKYLDLKLKDSGLLGGKQSICLSKLQDPEGLLQAFAHYLGRHRTMESHRAQSRQAA